MSSSDAADRAALAEEWWENRRLFDTDTGRDLEVGPSMQRYQYDDAVASLVQNPATLGSILEQLVAAAPRPEELPALETFVLEDAHAAMGGRVFVILAESNVSVEDQKRILAGFTF